MIDGEAHAPLAAWNPLALGHMVQHPPRAAPAAPAARAPNVVPVPYDFYPPDAPPGAHSGAAGGGGGSLLLRALEALQGRRGGASALAALRLPPARPPLPAHAQRFIPHTLFRPTALARDGAEVALGFRRDFSALLTPSLLLVAAHALRDGEELFMDWRLDPFGPQPAWYAPVDAAVNQRLWGVTAEGAERRMS